MVILADYHQKNLSQDKFYKISNIMIFATRVLQIYFHLNAYQFKHSQFYVFFFQTELLDHCCSKLEMFHEINQKICLVHN